MNAFTFVLSGMAIAALCTAGSGHACPASVTVSYSVRPSETSGDLAVAIGKKCYVVNLVPDPDIAGNVGDLVLTIHKSLRDDENLLTNGKNYHGYQAYDFSASDFQKGAGLSIYDKQRTIMLRNSGVVIKIDTSEVDVAPTSSSHGEPYKFEKLSLKVTAQGRSSRK